MGTAAPAGLRPGSGVGSRWQNLEFTADGRWEAFPMLNVAPGRWRHEPDGTLLALNSGGMTQRGVLGWYDLHPWLFPVARAARESDQLVLLDDTNHELQRLRPTTRSWGRSRT